MKDFHGNCAFINNTDNDGRAINMDIGSSASLDRNWFGNTAENYKTSPNAYIYGAGLGNWLFLNATVNPESISTHFKSICVPVYITLGLLILSIPLNLFIPNEKARKN